MSKVREYRFKVTEETFIVWLAGINRYLQLKEPAFYVFRKWTKGINNTSIAKGCTKRYALSYEESLRFANEITGRLEGLYNLSREVPETFHTEVEFPPKYLFFSERNYLITGKNYRFYFGNQYLEDLFHPLFRHMESPALPTGEQLSFEIIISGDYFAFRINYAELKLFKLEEPDRLQGAVYMELLNHIHGKKMDDWMGTIHGSAVSDGQQALIFTGSTRSGKSTVAALMLAHGYIVLSDDFIPVALREPEICHFPEGISVKNSAFEILREYFPVLTAREKTVPVSIQDYEVYLPASGKKDLSPDVKASAIILVQYDPEVDYQLTKLSNLEAMNDFLKQSWIADTPEAAVRFMDWYFDLPVYSLRYSDNMKLVSGIYEIFHKRTG